jgi:hypothetical protein
LLLRLFELGHETGGEGIVQGDDATEGLLAMVPQRLQEMPRGNAGRITPGHVMVWGRGCLHQQARLLQWAQDLFKETQRNVVLLGKRHG